MKANDSHTSLPWTMADDGMGTWGIYGPKGESIATVGGIPQSEQEAGEQAANAAFIVRACNAHEELIEALKAIHKALGMIHDFGTATGENPDIQNRALDNAEAAINKAIGVMS